ncbi:G5 domain-containing protein [Clostridium sp. D2Q-14]|uniref:G5 domain-containing protein n=1 Tax=Anaeromonas gelatinilytica TaxID=2683194 RepID=UPI00193B24D5|nr:G5 domain-containing protein [Anaeromonas gelatinilytica]MBS4536408.1 G5 domain-containing protein [Anaeromonas gelatinilytica]
MIIKLVKSIIKYRFIVICFILGIILGRFTAPYIVDFIMGGDIAGIAEDKEDEAVITTKEETVEESVPFYIEKEDDPTLELGTEIVEKEGVDGLKKVTYEITLTAGEETDRKVISNEITKSPINKIIKVGTKELGENQEKDLGERQE